MALVPYAGSPTAPRARGVITSHLRMKKDLAELATAKMTSPHVATHISFPEGDILNMKVTLRVAAGFYAGGTFVLSLRVPSNYPFRAPAVHSLTRVWHPNVDVETGRVYHPLLDRDWKPVLSINTVVFGLQLLFLEPNAECPINAVAAHTLVSCRATFAAHVRQSMRGGTWQGLSFPAHGSPGARARKRCRDSNGEDCADDIRRLSVDDSGLAKRPCFGVGGTPMEAGPPMPAPSWTPPPAGPSPVFTTAEGYPLTFAAHHQ